MSATADVMEMQTLFEKLAEALGLPAKDKPRVNALGREFRDEKGNPLFTANRVYELLKGKARRVDGYKKDAARARVAQIERQRAVDQINNLNRTLAYLKATDPDGYRTHIDRMEHQLALAGVLDRAVAEANTHDND